MLIGCSVCMASTKGPAWKTIPRDFDPKILKFIIKTCRESGIDYELIFALIAVESSWDIHARNKNKNGTIDYGLMQLNSSYINEFIERYGSPKKKYQPKINVYDNIEIGIRHFARLYKEWNGDSLLALYSYNCGKRNTSIGCIQPKTKKYARDILTIYDPSSYALF